MDSLDPTVLVRELAYQDLLKNLNDFKLLSQHRPLPLELLKQKHAALQRSVKTLADSLPKPPRCVESTHQPAPKPGPGQARPPQTKHGQVTGPSGTTTLTDRPSARERTIEERQAMLDQTYRPTHLTGNRRVASNPDLIRQQCALAEKELLAMDRLLQSATLEYRELMVDRKHLAEVLTRLQIISDRLGVRAKAEKPGTVSGRPSP
jgi:hypothetical protein